MISEVVVTPDWAIGYDMQVPCYWKDCDREVEWFGNQHGCTRGHCCSYHLRGYIAFLMDDLRDRGKIVCQRCHERFYMLPHFFTAVRA